jgi:uncharacterized protein (TIGR02001 family)
MAVGVMAHAEITTSGTVAFTTDYKFRGITQTSNNAAVQGSVTASHDSGVYASAWGSSVSGLTGGSEMDFMLGFAGASGDVAYDVGVMRYAYPGANRGNNSGALPDYNEVYASVSTAGAKVGVAYSDDYFGETGKYSYLYASYGTELAGFGVSASVGYNKLYDSGKSFSVANTTEDKYIDYKAAVSKSVGGIGFEVAYIGTDLKEIDQPGLNVDGSVVVTASKSF